MGYLVTMLQAFTLPGTNDVKSHSIVQMCNNEISAGTTAFCSLYSVITRTVTKSTMSKTPYCGGLVLTVTIYI